MSLRNLIILLSTLCLKQMLDFFLSQAFQPCQIFCMTPRNKYGIFGMVAMLLTIKKSNIRLRPSVWGLTRCCPSYSSYSYGCIHFSFFVPPDNGWMDRLHLLIKHQDLLPYTQLLLPPVNGTSRITSNGTSWFMTMHMCVLCSAD